jgi:hypothetical protein
LHALACCRRDALLCELAALAPLIAHLGGTQAVGETLLAVRDVAQWWP